MRKAERMRNNGIVAVLLVVTSFFVADVSAKERKHGAELLIQKKDGREIRGELLTVKGSRLLLMDSSSLSGVTLDIEEISRIRVVKKSKFFKSAGKGLLWGGGIGAALGFAQGDTEFMFSTITAGELALALGLTCGVIAGSVGGILGYSKGIDELIDLEGRSSDEIGLILNKLNSRSRYPEALPENIKIESSDLHKNAPKSIDRISPARSPISLKVDLASKKQKRGLSRFHLSLEQGRFYFRGSESLIKAFRGWGFGDSRRDFGYPTGATENSLFFKNIKIEFSLTHKIALGFSYSPLPNSKIEGFRCLENYIEDLGWLGSYHVEDGLGLYSEIEGSVYYFSAAFMPIPDAYLRKSSFKIGAGLGLSDVHYIVSIGIGERSNISKSSLSLMTFAEYNYWFSRGVTLGSYLDYKYIPCRIGFQLDADWKGQRILVDFPKKKVNFGGFGVGLILGFHL